MNPFDIEWQRPDLIHLVWLVLLFCGLLAMLEFRSHEVLGRFVSPLMQFRLAERMSPGRRIARLVAISLGLFLGVLALMGPEKKASREQVSSSRMSADIVFVLDVSRSMLADDAAPTRLGRAKAEILSLLQELPDQRVGLVAFAGRAQVLCPLTPDYNFFRMILRQVDTGSVTRGGTRIGDAIRAALKAYGASPGGRLMLLITDGEDHDSYPVEAAEQAVDASVRIITIGFGSEKGSKITLVDPETGARSLLTDNQGNVVESRLDGTTLREIAEATEGAYIPAGVAALDLESIVEEHIEPMARESTITREQIRPDQQYPWFVLGSLLCIFAAVWIGSTAGRRTR